MPSTNDYSYLPDEMENACVEIENGIEEISLQLEKIVSVANTISDSPNDWKGADANKYIENMLLYEGDMLDLNSAYQSAVNTLRGTVKVANDRAIETARQVGQELFRG